MRTTRERAEALAAVIREFPFLAPASADDLLELIRLEAGHAEVLDGFRPYGKTLLKATAPGTIVHVVSGNTPHAALQSLVVGLLIGSRNLVKIPSAGLPAVAEFLGKLPPELGSTVEVQDELAPAWLETADAVIVFGSDETVAEIRRRVPGSAKFFPHGHRVSFSVIFDDPELVSVAGAAADVSRFDQQGCLSPHVIYVNEAAGLEARTYADALAREMAAYEARDPRGTLTVEEAGAILDLRSGYRFRAASDHRVQLWESPAGDAWTVIYEEDPWFVSSCLNRVIFVKPLPGDLAFAVDTVKPWLGAIGIWPASIENAERVAPLGPSRICPVGKMQEPLWSWHQEGRKVLAPLLDFVDFETADQ